MVIVLLKMTQSNQNILSDQDVNSDVTPFMEYIMGETSDYFQNMGRPIFMEMRATGYYLPPGWTWAWMEDNVYSIAGRYRYPKVMVNYWIDHGNTSDFTQTQHDIIADYIYESIDDMVDYYRHMDEQAQESRRLARIANQNNQP